MNLHMCVEKRIQKKRKKKKIKMVNMVHTVWIVSFTGYGVLVESAPISNNLPCPSMFYSFHQFHLSFGDWLPPPPPKKEIKIKIGHLKFTHDFLINQFNLYAKQLTTSS